MANWWDAPNLRNIGEEGVTYAPGSLLGAEPEEFSSDGDYGMTRNLGYEDTMAWRERMRNLPQYQGFEDLDDATENWQRARVGGQEGILQQMAGWQPGGYGPGQFSPHEQSGLVGYSSQRDTFSHKNPSSVVWQDEVPYFFSTDPVRKEIPKHDPDRNFFEGALDFWNSDAMTIPKIALGAYGLTSGAGGIPGGFESEFDAPVSLEEPLRFAQNNVGQPTVDAPIYDTPYTEPYDLQIPGEEVVPQDYRIPGEEVIPQDYRIPGEEVVQPPWTPDPDIPDQSVGLPGSGSVPPAPTVSIPGYGDVYTNDGLLNKLKTLWGVAKDAAGIKSVLASLGITGAAAQRLFNAVTGQKEGSALRGGLSLLGGAAMLNAMNSKPGAMPVARPGGQAQGAGAGGGGGNLGMAGLGGPKFANVSKFNRTPFKSGGMAEKKKFFFDKLREPHVKGAEGGQADTVPAMLSHGEYVMDAETVAHLGDGNNEAGAKKLDAMRENIRKHKRGGPLSTIPKPAKSPEQYLPKKV